MYLVRCQGAGGSLISISTHSEGTHARVGCIHARTCTRACMLCSTRAAPLPVHNAPDNLRACARLLNARARTLAHLSHPRQCLQRVEQPAAAGLLLLQRGGAAAEAAKGRPWRKQVPRWVALAVLDQVRSR